MLIYLKLKRANPMDNNQRLALIIFNNFLHKGRSKVTHLRAKIKMFLQICG